MYGNKDILWRYWRDSYNYDWQHGVRTFQKLSDEHFDLTPSSRMRNHLADDVLSPRMKELMVVKLVVYIVSFSPVTLWMQGWDLT